MPDDPSQMSFNVSRTALDSLSQLICVIDAVGCIIDVNAAWRCSTCRSRLCSRDIVIGMNYLECCDTAEGAGNERAAEAAEGIRRVLRGELQRVILEYPCARTGNERWFVMTATRYESPAGGGAVIEHEEITSRKLAEIQSQELAARLKQVVESTHDGIWLWRQPEGREFFSERMYTMLGYEHIPEGEEGTFFFSLVHPDESPEINRIFKEFTSGQRDTLDVECRIRAANGKWRWIWSRGRIAERDAEGRPALLAGSHTDITDRKTLESHLRQSQKLEAVGTLAGGIAHEFNNILAGILGYAELAESELTPGTSPYRDVEHVREAAMRARSLIRQIVTFSRASELDRHPLRLQVILKESLNLLRSTLPDSIKVSDSIDDDCPPVRCDATQMHQMVLSLCTNAAQSMGDNGGMLQVEYVSLPRGTFRPESGDELDYVRLRVADSGKGIPEAIRERIFDPFFTTHDVGNGTGLGLSMIHGIVRAHGGEIRFESVEGDGSTFDVYLPAIQESAPEESAPSRAPGGAGEHIVLIEDEPVLRSLFKRRLTNLGYVVRDFEDGEAAVDFIRDPSNSVEVVVTDQKMGKMQGIQVVDALRTLRANLPVILMTGHSDLVDASNYRDYGFCAYLEKPVLIPLLASALRTALTPSP